MCNRNDIFWIFARSSSVNLVKTLKFHSTIQLCIYYANGTEIKCIFYAQTTKTGKNFINKYVNSVKYHIFIFLFFFFSNSITGTLYATNVCVITPFRVANNYRWADMTLFFFFFNIRSDSENRKPRADIQTNRLDSVETLQFFFNRFFYTPDILFTFYFLTYRFCKKKKKNPVIRYSYILGLHATSGVIVDRGKRGTRPPPDIFARSKIITLPPSTLVRKQ